MYGLSCRRSHAGSKPPVCRTSILKITEEKTCAVFVISSANDLSFFRLIIESSLIRTINCRPLVTTRQQCGTWENLQTSDLQIGVRQRLRVSTSMSFLYWARTLLFKDEIFWIARAHNWELGLEAVLVLRSEGRYCSWRVGGTPAVLVAYLE